MLGLQWQIKIINARFFTWGCKAVVRTCALGPDPASNRTMSKRRIFVWRSGNTFAKMFRIYWCLKYSGILSQYAKITYTEPIYYDY